MRQKFKTTIELGRGLEMDNDHDDSSMNDSSDDHSSSLFSQFSISTDLLLYKLQHYLLPRRPFRVVITIMMKKKQ